MGIGPIERDAPYRLVVVAFADGVAKHLTSDQGAGNGATDPSLVPCVVSGGTSTRVLAGGGTFCRSVLPDDLGLLMVDVRMAPRSAALIPLQGGLTRLLALRVEGVVDIEGANSSSQSVALMECRPDAKSLSFRTAQEGARVIVIGTLYEPHPSSSVFDAPSVCRNAAETRRRRRWGLNVDPLSPQ